MVRAGLGYLAAADAAQLSAATQAECLRELEQADAVLTAARAFVLAGFTAGQGYADDAGYSARSWLIHRTHITPGAAVGHTAWAKRTGTHPAVLAALAAGQVSESAGRLICLWTGKLPEKYQEESDELLLAAAAAGLAVEELAALFAEMYERARGDLPDQDPDRGLRRPQPQAGDHVRRRRRDPRGTHAGVRGADRAGAGRAGRQGREGR
jgi:anthranilate phosphoribosyltransferase